MSAGTKVGASPTGKLQEINIAGFIGYELRMQAPPSLIF
jgi:hypothetical protein